jgi:hypothetical protein
MFNIEDSKELLLTGNIVQDYDESISDDESECRFNRYIELLDLIDGSEDIKVTKLIIQSMRAKDDYGAYQTAIRKIFSFPSDICATTLISELPSLIEENKEWAGEILCGLANEIEDIETPYIDAFLIELNNTDQDMQRIIINYIKEEERKGWLTHRISILSL